jgi:cell division protein FtsL
LTKAQKHVFRQELPEKNEPLINRTRHYILPTKKLLTYAGLIFAGFCLGLLTIFFYTQVQTTNYQIYCLKENLAVLDMETQELSGKLARLSSLEKVEAAATTRLGMVPADYSNVLLVKVPEEKKKSVATEKGNLPGRTTRLNHKQGQNWLIQAFVNLVNRS